MTSITTIQIFPEISTINNGRLKKLGRSKCLEILSKHPQTISLITAGYASLANHFVILIYGLIPETVSKLASRPERSR